MASSAAPVLVLENEPERLRDWAGAMWHFRHLLAMLSRAQFHVRYKRASFGVAWAVGLPLIQAAVLTIVFEKLVRVSGGLHFGAYVLSGVLAWSYFSQTVAPGSTAIVEGSSLTDKVWFPRAILPATTVFANLPGLAVSMAFLVVALPVLGVPLGIRVLLLPLACALLIAFTLALVEVLAALHVYFRDVRFLVQAALVVWFYVTPIAYPKALLKGLATWIDVNPLTGIVALFHLATVGNEANWQRPLLFALAWTAVLVIAAVEAHRRRDRLFVDLL
ncbi:MAG: ABC transporter permease [Acidimicrobiia bacterium]|nr:ABC transporter permease [Acidimicrobiia bacterium]